MIRDFDFLYLSPHLDDAALSCGGQIAQQTAAGRSVLIATLMAGEPPDHHFSAFAQGQHTRWHLETGTVARRRAEDAAACEILGADFRHLDVPDCIYRRDPQSGETYYNSDEDLFGRVHPQEEGLIGRLQDLFTELPTARQVIAPLTAGNHVDHQLTRLAAERFWGNTLLYYEDYPYVREEQLLAAAVAPTGAATWTPREIPLTRIDLQRKIAAIAAYHSQVDMFFEDTADLERQITAYAKRVGGERLWHKKMSASGEKG